MEKLEIAAGDGARVEACTHGAQVTSWKPASGEERLFLSDRSTFAPDAAIRGGVPIIFPQFGGMGALPKHGFARVVEWEAVRAGRASTGRGEGHFRLTANARTVDVGSRFLGELRRWCRGHVVIAGAVRAQRG
jgi:glucose-6-phosphate 1-epimerase